MPPAPALAKKPVVLADREVLKPIGVLADTGEFVTLAKYYAEPAALSQRLASLANLGYEKQAEFTIARLRHEPETLRIAVLGQHEFTRDEIMREISAGSPVGQQFVQIEQAWVERVKEKVSKGEYKLRVQPASARGQ